MAPENKSKSTNPNKNNKKRKNYLPHNKPVKKGAYPLRPGVEGFFITCDGGREYQASHEAINVIDSFYDELVEGKVEQAELCKKPMNKIIKFTDSDSSGSESDDADDEDTNNDNVEDKNDVQIGAGESKDEIVLATSAGGSDESAPEIKDNEAQQKNEENEKPENDEKKEADESALEVNDDEAQPKIENDEQKEAEVVEPPAKRQCIEADAPKCEKLSVKSEQKSVDQLIEEELKELGDKSKRRFNKLDTGCNGVVFIQMRKKDGDPGPKEIVHHMMTSLASTKKHVSRFLLRVLPVEVSCYTSDEEIKRAIKPVIEKYFPVETQNPRKFSVLYDARANTGIDRAKVIDAVAKSVPSLHKVDLANPDISIVVQIVKTICLIGVVEKYKELAKYNVRQLSS